MFQTKVVENIKTLNLYSITFFIYEIMWKIIVQQERPQLRTWRMRIACWITKVTNTHSQYVILIAFPLPQWLQERASILCLHAYCLSCNVS